MVVGLLIDVLRKAASDCYIRHGFWKVKGDFPLPHITSLTDETYHMVNKEVLSTLGKEGVIVNVGRGALINEKELVRCLVGEYIKGAGLDVFENDNASNVPEELFQLDNVVFFLHTLLYLLQSLLRRLLQL
uniref:D-isomer specific 2-hydroxyacid dehydrogenase NAD-binding domain-containing protein n=2 Tax=Cannabis sativa TaxID=3483 RepID=A0A803RBF7_CANSA